jgi:hypothetical protein
MEQEVIYQPKYKSWVLIASAIAQMLSILVMFDVVTLTQSEALNVLVVAIMQVLVAFGLGNSPDKKNAY